MSGIGIAVIVITVLIVIWASIKRKQLIFNKKAVFFILIVGVCLIVYGNISSASNEPVVEVPYWQESAPSYSKAPYVVQTPSRVYYVKEYTVDDNLLMLDEYYTFDKNKWRKMDIPLPIDKSIPAYADVSIKTRM